NSPFLLRHQEKPPRAPASFGKTLGAPHGGRVVTDGHSAQGLATLWVNGENVARVPGVAEGHILPRDGRSGMYRDLDSSVAFTGKMTGVNMWDHVLDAGRIKEYANQDGSCDSRGNVIGWGVSEIIPHGGAQYIN
ncbi:hypothetical protein M9458_004261, partial [Cirrhinus mrigala]